MKGTRKKDGSINYFRLLFLSSIVVLLIRTDALEETSSGFHRIPENPISIEGYVVSKRMNEIWIADQQLNILERINGFFTSNYGKSTVIVMKHAEAQQKHMLSQAKINQKIVVYSENIRESNPPSTLSYYIELK